MTGSRTSPEFCRVLLLCAAAAGCPHTLSALDPDRHPDQYIVTRWSSRDSFPGGAINAIAQTPDGYLWIGSEHGLIRFDGISFRLLDSSNSPSMPPGSVLGLAVDGEGLLWVRMQSPYLMRRRGATFDQMFPVPLPPPFSSASERGATAFTRGKDGKILIAPPDAPLRYVDGKFTAFLSSGEAGGLPISIAETMDGVVWVGMRDTGLFRVRDGRGSRVALPDQKVNVLLPGSGPELWIGTDSGLFRWDGTAVTRLGVPDGLARRPVLALARDRDANLWISTSAGITRMASNGNTVHGSAATFPGAVQAIVEDREGNLWFGGTAGLVQLRDAPFLSFDGVAGEGGSLYVDNSGRTWIGPASGGLIRIRGAEHGSIRDAGLDRDVIYSIAGGPGEVWVGRRLGGLTLLREEGPVLRHRTYTVRDGLAPGAVYAVHRCRDASVWVGTLSGAVSRIQKSRISTFTTTNGLSADAVTTIQETPDRVVWVGTAGGLQAFENGRWRQYRNEDGLPPGRVNSLVVDDDGVLWIGTSSGLAYRSGRRIESARNTPAPLQREIYGLAADRFGNLWASTDRHVVSVARASLLEQSVKPAAVREFGLADGLPSTRGVRRDRSVARDHLGRIWFSLHGGLAVVNPALPSARAPALVKVESVAVDGRPLAPGASYRSNHNRLIFNFIGLSLTIPGRVRYRYLLEGYDRDWSEPSESREAAYTSLPPARYTFRVTASNSEGLWNEVPASFAFEVQPQLSETWWFRMAVLGLAAVTIFAAFRYRVARVHAAMNLRFEERLAERTRIARELHDTLLQSFQGLMLRLQVVNELLPPGKAREQLEQSLERADQAVAEGRNALYDLRSSTATTNDLAQAVRALGEDMATEDGAAFHLVVEGRTRELHPIVRDEVYRITREALRNAFTHALARHIETEITYGERALRVRIRDDGQGVPPHMLQAGRPGHYGISGMRERARQIGARLEVWSRANAGTEVELSIEGSVAYFTRGRLSLWQLFRKRQVEP